MSPSDVLFSDMVEVLPPGQTILELLESVELTDVVKERCRQLKRKNYRIALDDHVYSPEHHDLYSFVDIVKIDLLETDPADLPGFVAALRRFPVTLLAERIETTERFQDCLELGFELFQGYFFSRPVVLKRKGLEPSRMAMLRLLGHLQGETDFGKIEEIFRDHPELSYNMLKLVNSVHMGLREKIKSLRHAIMLLRARQAASLGSTGHLRQRRQPGDQQPPAGDGCRSWAPAGVPGHGSLPPAPRLRSGGFCFHARHPVTGGCALRDAR